MSLCCSRDFTAESWADVFTLAADLVGKIPLKEASPEVLQAVRALHDWVEAKNGSPSPSLSSPLTLEEILATARVPEAQGQGEAREDPSCHHCGKPVRYPHNCDEDPALD